MPPATEEVWHVSRPAAGARAGRRPPLPGTRVRWRGFGRRALDVNDTLLELLRGRVAESGLTNIEGAKVERDDPKLPPGSVDTILMVDTLHYIQDRPAYARKLAAGLAPGGRVVIIDFLPKPIEERPWGPPPEQKMAVEEVDAAMAAAGLVPTAVHGFLTEQFFVEYRAAAVR